MVCARPDGLMKYEEPRHSLDVTSRRAEAGPVRPADARAMRTGGAPVP
jgi:hypothetical protein